VHGTLNGSTHAMKDRVRSLAGAHSNIRATTFHVESRPEAGYYLCGPRPFLRAFVGGLAVAGARSTRTHYEFFGPADEILTAA